MMQRRGVAIALAFSLAGVPYASLVDEEKADPSSLADEGSFEELNLDEHFNVMDENKDGKLSKDEFFRVAEGEEAPPAEVLAEFDRSLQKVDTDGDGMISIAEMPALNDAMLTPAASSLMQDGGDEQEEMEQEMQEHEQMMKEIDTNKDGKISRDEMPSDTEKAYFDKNIERADKNGDGLISIEEMPGMLAQFDSQVDSEEDASIQMSLMHEEFLSLDENKDGRLSKDEVFKFDQEHEKPSDEMIAHFDKNLPTVDKDGDGLISFEEMPAMNEVMASFSETLHAAQDALIELDGEEEQEVPGTVNKGAGQAPYGKHPNNVVPDGHIIERGGRMKVDVSRHGEEQDERDRMTHVGAAVKSLFFPHRTLKYPEVDPSSLPGTENLRPGLNNPGAWKGGAAWR